nr:hypothetical protein [Pseudorhodoplanes sinuspersici]
MRQHLDIDAGFIHVANAFATEILQSLLYFVAFADLASGEVRREFRIPVMFFYRDN